MIDAEAAEAWLDEREADVPEPGTEAIEREDVRVRIAPYAFPWAATVRHARWSEDEAERGIDGVVDLFRRRGRRFVWIVGPSSRPRDLAQRLRRRGFEKDVEGDERILVARLPLTLLSRNPDVRIVEVTDEATLRDHVAVYGSRWTDDLFRQRRRYLGRPASRSGYLVAYLGDAAAGTAGWTHTRDGRAVLLNGGTVRSEYRRRGVYSEMTRRRTERARARGCQYAVLLANPETSGPILLKRGFVDLGPMPILYSPP